jgi:hypothetical protein
MNKAMEILSSQIGPLKFNLIEFSNKTEYFNFHNSLNKITLQDLKSLSDLIRNEEGLDSEEFVVIVSAKSLETPNKKLKTFKDWISFYQDRNIVIKSSGWDKVTENRPHLGIAHQIIENLFQNLSQVDLESIKLNESIHMEVEPCLNSFCENLKETRFKISSGHICGPCQKKALFYVSNNVIVQVRSILNCISQDYNDNCILEYSDKELTIEVTGTYEIFIGGNEFKFDVRAKKSKITYLFYLINHGKDIGVSDFRGNYHHNDAYEKFKSLHEKLSGKTYDYEIDSYLNDPSYRHTKIYKRMKEIFNSEFIANKYRIASTSETVGEGKRTSTVTTYHIDIEPKHLNIPKDLLEFRVSA